MVGALNRIVSFSRIYNKPPSLPETKIILKDLLNLSENKVTIDAGSGVKLNIARSYISGLADNNDKIEKDG